MLPPRKEVVFNKHLKHNDGVLVGYISANANVSTDEASAMVRSYVEGLQKSIRATGNAVVDGVGSFMAIGKEVAFIADNSTNYLDDSYGFAPQYLEIPSQSIFAAPSLEQVRRVAASVAVLFCLMAVAPETKDASVSSQAGLLQLSEMTVPSVIVANDSQVAPEVDNTAEETIVQDEAYYIIVGSFPSERDADRFIANLNKQGVDGLNKIKFGKRVRVSAAQFDDHSEAVKNNRAMRKIKGFEKAWVLCEKR